jgi:hypothetical protein
MQPNGEWGPEQVTTTGELQDYTRIDVATPFGFITIMDIPVGQFQQQTPYLSYSAARDGVAVLALTGYDRKWGTWVVRYSETGISASDISSRIPNSWEISEVSLALANEKVIPV